MERTKNVLDIFDKHSVPCIRVGLCASENLSDASKAIGGATHSAIGEMAMSRLYFERICNELERIGAYGGSAIVYVSEGAVSKAVGQKKENKIKVCEKYRLEWIKVLEKNDISGYNIRIDYFTKEDK